MRIKEVFRKERETKWIWKKILMTVCLLLICLVLPATSAFAYTEKQKRQAKSWLKRHGYPPTRDGAYQAYDDYLGGKYWDEFGPPKGREKETTRKSNEGNKETKKSSDDSSSKSSNESSKSSNETTRSSGESKKSSDDNKKSTESTQSSRNSTENTSDAGGGSSRSTEGGTGSGNTEGEGSGGSGDGYRSGDGTAGYVFPEDFEDEESGEDWTDEEFDADEEAAAIMALMNEVMAGEIEIPEESRESVSAATQLAETGAYEGEDGRIWQWLPVAVGAALLIVVLLLFAVRRDGKKKKR